MTALGPLLGDRRIAVSGIALAGTIAALLSLLPSPALAVPEATQVTRTDLSSSVLVGGLVVPERSTPLFFSPTVVAAGIGRTRRVKAVHVRNGRAVSEGDVLVELEGDDLREQLDEAKRALSQAVEAQRRAEAAARAQEAHIAQLAGEVSQAQASARQAASGAAQAQGACASLANSLVETAIGEVASLPPPPPPPSIASMPRTQAALQALLECQGNLAESAAAAGAASATAQALAGHLDSLRSSRVRVSAAGAQASAARRNVERLERLIKALTLIAPYDGIVSALNAQEGSTLPPGVPALEIRTASLVARADLAEGDLVGLSPGAAAEVSIRSARLELVSTLTSIAEDPSGSVGGPVVYPAYFDLPPEPTIKPGQLVRVRIVVETRRGVLAVPSSAVTESKGLHYVVVVSDGKEERRRVIPGLSDESRTEIIRGLEEGEKVRTLAPRA